MRLYLRGFGRLEIGNGLFALAALAMVGLAAIRASTMPTASLFGIATAATSPRAAPPSTASDSPLVITRCRASFFIIGARKGGTTSLYSWLAALKDVLQDQSPKDASLVTRKVAPKLHDAFRSFAVLKDPKSDLLKLLKRRVSDAIRDN